jgi:hypothetical protein
MLSKIGMSAALDQLRAPNLRVTQDIKLSRDFGAMKRASARLSTDDQCDFFSVRV